MDNQRESFISDWLAHRTTLTELCGRYRISRKTGSKWVQRFYEGGLPVHRTLKAETARPPKGDAAAQQRAFNEFRQCYNEERPHQALANATPASIYRPSPRAFPEIISDPFYPPLFEVRRAYKDGMLALFGGYACLSPPLGLQAIGVEAVDDDRWRLCFGPVYLGVLSKVGKGLLEFLRNSPK